VTALLDTWPAVYCDAQGAIYGYWGLAIPEMGYEFHVGGQQLYAWCAWDTLFMPELIGAPADVVSPTPSGEIVRLHVDANGNVESDRDGIVVSIVVPDEAIKDDVQSTFCHYVYFFEDRVAGEAWAKGRPNIELLTLGEAVELGRRKNALMYDSPLPESPVDAGANCIDACGVPA